MMLLGAREAVRQIAKAVAIAVLSELAIRVTMELYDRAAGVDRIDRDRDERHSNERFEPHE